MDRELPEAGEDFSREEVEDCGETLSVLGFDSETVFDGIINNVVAYEK